MLSRLFYFGESVLAARLSRAGHWPCLLRSPRGAGQSVRRDVPACFAAVIRPADHPLKPAHYVPHDAFWTKRGYGAGAGAGDGAGRGGALARKARARSRCSTGRGHGSGWGDDAVHPGRRASIRSSSSADRDADARKLERRGGRGGGARARRWRRFRIWRDGAGEPRSPRPWAIWRDRWRAWRRWSREADALDAALAAGAMACISFAASLPRPSTRTGAIRNAARLFAPSGKAGHWRGQAG